MKFKRLNPGSSENAKWLLVALLVQACTTEHGYQTAQAWQRNQCERMPDSTQRQQCLAKLNMSYDEYRTLRYTNQPPASP